jgi:dihydroorotate dehydrogenase
MNFYSSLARPLLFQLSPEVAHHLTLASLRIPLISRLLTLGKKAPSDPTILMNLPFRNRLGVAAGLDKNAEAPLAWRNLGFGFAELGTITFHPQPGNPKPRVFRYPHQQALINRLGFPNLGADAIATRLRKLRGKHALHDFPIGINLGKSKVTPLDQAPLDYLGSLKLLQHLGDFLSSTSALRTHPDSAT